MQINLLHLITGIVAVKSLLVSIVCYSQVSVSGRVFDSTKLYVVPGVNVLSNSGQTAITDSLGGYHLDVTPGDSISFIYRGKSTIKFPVKDIINYNAFDISLRVKINDKYKLLKEVTVFSNTYKRDSLENRLTYAKIFNREKPTVRSNYDPGGAAGLDLDELVNMFRFRKNKQDIAFQKRLVEEEEDRYVNYRFNSKLISRITGLSGDTLTRYKTLYRPSYEFIIASSLTQFYQYILNTSYAFKREEGLP